MACSSQASIGTLPFDVPIQVRIIETQKDQNVGLCTSNRDGELGSDCCQTGWVYPAGESDATMVVEVSTLGSRANTMELYHLLDYDRTP